MDTQKEIAIMTDKKQASILYLNSINNATSLLDVLLKNNIVKVENQDEALKLHSELRDTILISHNKFTNDVLSKIGTGPSDLEIQEVIKKVNDCKDLDSLRTVYLTTREAVRQSQVVLDAVTSKKEALK
jgi:hypothetical protein